ncbi:MAG: IS110 family transposase [bacterium]
MYDWLEEEVKDAKLAHPLKVKAIAEARIKTDKIDAKTLADLLRADLIPEAYVPSQKARAAKNILRQRMFFVKVRTMVKNRIQAILDHYPDISNQWSGTDLFGKQGKSWLNSITLPEPDNKLLKEQIKFFDSLTERIKASDYLVSILAKTDNRVAHLRTIPGIGLFFATLIAYEIDEIKRFRIEKKFRSYIGIIPSTFQTSETLYHGRITREGNKYIRWALIEAVWPAMNKDYFLRACYNKIRQRRGVNIAKVATARRLATIVYRVLSQSRPYIVNYPGRPHVFLTNP